jgi:hypothetical protein
MNNYEPVSWNNLMDMINIDEYSKQLVGDLLTEDIYLEDCVRSTKSVKRTYQEMISSGENKEIVNYNENLNNNRKYKFN